MLSSNQLTRGTQKEGLNEVLKMQFSVPVDCFTAVKVIFA